MKPYYEADGITIYHACGPANDPRWVCAGKDGKQHERGKWHPCDLRLQLAPEMSGPGAGCTAPDPATD